MNLSNLHPAEGSKHSDSFRRGRGTLLEMVRLLVRDIRARRHVPAHRDLVSRAADAVIQTSSEERIYKHQLQEIVGINVSVLERFENDSVVTLRHYWRQV